MRKKPILQLTNATDDYWEWETGGSTVYMPTFNKNKDSLVADINGTFAENYEDYVDYSLDENKTKTGTEIYDGDSNSVDEVQTNFDNLENYSDYIKTVEGVEHTAKETGNASLISMAEWLQLVEDGENTANYWVYDEDGWCYWSSPIKAGETTGLLLDGIKLKQVMDDSYYYAIEVTAQFITADDLGKDDGTGFYADTTGDVILYTAPSDNALKLLKAIGVDTGDVEVDDDDGEIDLTKAVIGLGHDYFGNYTQGSVTWSSEKNAYIYTGDADTVTLMITNETAPSGVSIDYANQYYINEDAQELIESTSENPGNFLIYYYDSEGNTVAESCGGTFDIYPKTFSGEQTFEVTVEVKLEDNSTYQYNPVNVIVTGKKQ